jgi:hypothetical protein
MLLTQGIDFEQMKLCRHTVGTLQKHIAIANAIHAKAGSRFGPRRGS